MSLYAAILDVLEVSDLPVATPDIIAIATTEGTPHPRQQIWAILRRWEHQGFLRRSHGRSRIKDGYGGNQRVAMWTIRKGLDTDVGAG